MIGTLFLGRYEAIGQLGKGSMGQVFLARQVDNARMAVIKMMHPHIAAKPHLRALFEREMQFMARFRHPYSAELFDASLDAPQGACIVMEYLPGITLEDMLVRDGRLPIDRVVWYTDTLCHALEAAHRCGIVHRDLKPANLMVVDADTERELLKVMDFGLASLSIKPHLSLEKLTGQGGGFAVGTPAYMSPEQARGDEADHRADLYAVGVILYEVLTGKLPFDYEDAHRVMEAHASEPPVPFRRLGITDVPDEVESVVMTCLAKYPNERPQSAAELAEMLAAATGWQRSPPPVPPEEYTPPPEDTHSVPAAVEGPGFTRELEAWMPERIAVMKLRGFIEDLGGRVLASEPGLVKVRLREPPPPTPAKKGFIAWLAKLGESEPEKPPAPNRDPVEIDLHMDKRDSGAQSKLHIAVHFRPVEGRPLDNEAEWKQYCEKVFGKLAAYLMAR